MSIENMSSSELCELQNRLPELIEKARQSEWIDVRHKIIAALKAHPRYVPDDLERLTGVSVQLIVWGVGYDDALTWEAGKGKVILSGKES